MKISVVTVCFNAVNEIEKTIKSVLNQQYDDLEYIIIDGNSIDGTQEIIKKYDKKIAFYLSEKDNGVYDAMNKGINIATGEYINFMNAGDEFFDNYVLTRIFSNLNQNPAVIFGDVAFYENGKKYVQKSVPFYEHLPLHHSMGFNHQSSFVRSDYAKNKLFDLKFRLAADYDMIIRIFREGGSFLYLEDEIIAVYELNGLSDKYRRTHIFETLSVDNPNNNILNIIRTEFIMMKIRLGRCCKKIILYLSPSLFSYFKTKGGIFYQIG